MIFGYHFGVCVDVFFNCVFFKGTVNKGYTHNVFRETGGQGKRLLASSSSVHLSDSNSKQDWLATHLHYNAEHQHLLFSSLEHDVWADGIVAHERAQVSLFYTANTAGVYPRDTDKNNLFCPADR